MTEPNIIPGTKFQKVYGALIDSSNESISESNRLPVDSTPTTEEMLMSIIQELKIINLHLSCITDNDIKKSEVE